MEKVEILAVCSHEGILQTILRLINNNEQWHGTGATDVKQATALIKEDVFDLILMGSGLTAHEERELEAVLTGYKTVPLIKHYGGGSGLLFGEIHQALAGR